MQKTIWANGKFHLVQLEEQHQHCDHIYEAYCECCTEECGAK